MRLSPHLLIVPIPDPQCPSEDSEAGGQNLRHRDPQSCPSRRCWHRGHTEKAGPRRERQRGLLERKNERAAQGDGGRNRGQPVPGVPGVQGVPGRSPGGDPGRGGGADGDAAGDGGWAGDRGCAYGRGAFVE